MHSFGNLHECEYVNICSFLTWRFPWRSCHGNLNVTLCLTQYLIARSGQTFWVKANTWRPLCIGKQNVSVVLKLFWAWEHFTKLPTSQARRRNCPDSMESRGHKITQNQVNAHKINLIEVNKNDEVRESIDISYNPWECH